MAVTSKVFDQLWADLSPMLEEAAQRIVKVNGLHYAIGKSANSAFPFRAVASFTKHPQGDELTISVDALSINGGVKITCDACHEAKYLAEGPTVLLTTAADSQTSRTAIERWLNEFRVFLNVAVVKINEAAGVLR